MIPPHGCSWFFLPGPVLCLVWSCWRGPCWGPCPVVDYNVDRTRKVSLSLFLPVLLFLIFYLLLLLCLYYYWCIQWFHFFYSLFCDDYLVSVTVRNSLLLWLVMVWLMVGSDVSYYIILWWDWLVATMRLFSLLVCLLNWFAKLLYLLDLPFL